MATPPIANAPRAAASRDLRLDFFRGLALWFIFIDHVPSSIIGYLTYRNFGFSDATEVFVFISGYTAAIVYLKRWARQGHRPVLGGVYRRVWQLYSAHIFVFVVYVAQVSWIAGRFERASFLEELNIGPFLQDPATTLVEALKLHYRPVNLDVLPLYIALLAAFPLMLWIARHSVWSMLALSFALYQGVQWFGWAFPVYADGSSWFFNPLGWQLLFAIGIACACWYGPDAPESKGRIQQRLLQWDPRVAGLCLLWLIFSAVVALSWKFPALEARVSPLVEQWLYPIDKTGAGWPRVLHFLCFAWIVIQFTPRDARFLQNPLARAAVLCGQQSLPVFCLGICLSFAADFLLVEFGRSLFNQLGVIAGGIAVLTLLAGVLRWSRV